MSLNKQKDRKGPKRGKPTLRLVGTEKAPPEFGPDDRKYFRELHLIIDKIFAEAANSFDWTWAQLASHANLAYQTVANLGERITIYPRYQTIYKLAEAIGWQLSVSTAKSQRKAPQVKVAAS